MEWSKVGTICIAFVRKRAVPPTQFLPVPGARPYDRQPAARGATAPDTLRGQVTSPFVSFMPSHLIA